MRTNKVVTIWHYENPNMPVRKIFKNVYVDVVEKIDKNGIKQKGFFDATSAAVRIPTMEEINVLPGDYLYIGEAYTQFHKTEESLKIIEVKDNRHGSQKHWRITCGG